LGAVLLKAGRFEESADAYSRAVAMASGDVDMRLGLVEAQLGPGRILQARHNIDTLIGIRDRGQLTDAEQRDRLAAVIRRANEIERN